MPTLGSKPEGRLSPENAPSACSFLDPVIEFPCKPFRNRRQWEAALRRADQTLSPEAIFDRHGVCLLKQPGNEALERGPDRTRSDISVAEWLAGFTLGLFARGYPDMTRLSREVGGPLASSSRPPRFQETRARILSYSASGNSFSVVVRTFPLDTSDKRNVVSASSSGASTWMTRS